MSLEQVMRDNPVLINNMIVVKKDDRWYEVKMSIEGRFKYIEVELEVEEDVK